jgi:hypothetical protein
MAPKLVSAPAPNRHPRHAAQRVEHQEPGPRKPRAAGNDAVELPGAIEKAGHQYEPDTVAVIELIETIEPTPRYAELQERAAPAPPADPSTRCCLSRPPRAKPLPARARCSAGPGRPVWPPRSAASVLAPAVRSLLTRRQRQVPDSHTREARAPPPSALREGEAQDAGVSWRGVNMFLRAVPGLPASLSPRLAPRGSFREPFR